MPSNVEERIVAAKFDSSNFEKGVNRTVKKLDELKKNLKFEKTGESISELSKKTSEATEATSKSLEKLSDRFTSFTGMLKQKLLSGIADQVVGTFFKMEHAITGFMRSMSTGQMSAGMQKFESALTSVRMITASTYDEIDEKTGKRTGRRLNYEQDAAYAAVGKLQAYADETSYSMDQMVDAMSKMVSAGVGLEQAEKNVQGIANACAAAGVNATDAARAFFNLSQAYSSGSLKYTDYRSLQLLNMTNENFEEALLAAGVASGTLVEKKGKNGLSVYKTKKTKKNGKVVAGKTVNRKNLSESLKFNWADTEVMDYLFGNKFFVDVEDFQKAKKYSQAKNGGIYSAKDALEYLKNMEDETGKIDKATGKVAKKYSDLAANAFMAAREARNLTDVMNAIRDYVSSGWSQVFEKLFGRLETASEFFTQLSEGGIAGIFTGGIDWINDVLDSWNEGNQGGEAFRRTILQIDAAIGQLAGIFGDLLPDTGEFGRVLFDMSSDLEFASEQFMRWTDNVRKWLNSPDGENGVTRIKRIQNAIANLSGVFEIFRRLSSIVFSALNKTLILLEPVFDAIFQGIEKITKPIGDLGSENTAPFDALSQSITNVFTVLQPLVERLAPLITGVGSLLGDIGAFFLQMSIDGVSMNIQFFADTVGLLLEALGMPSAQQAKDGVGILGGIAAEINNIKDVCASALSTIKEFFGVLISDLRTLFGLPNEAGEVNKEGGLFSGVKKFFETNEFIKQAESWVEQAKKDVIAWFANLPAEINDFVESLLYEKETEIIYNEEGKEIGNITTIMERPLKVWLDQLVETVSKFIADLPSNLMKGIGQVSDIFSVIVDAIFGLNADSKGDNKNADKKQGEKGKEAIQKWANTFTKNIETSIKLLPIRIRYYINKEKRKAQKNLEAIKQWFSTSETIKTIQTWGQSLLEEFKKFILSLPELLKNKIKEAGAIGRNIIDVIKSIFASDDIKEGAESELDQAFKSISLTSVLNTITDLGKEIANQFLSWFTGSEDMEANFKWIGDKVSSLIKGIPSAIQTAINFVIEKLGNLWELLYDSLMGTGAMNSTQSDSNLKRKLDELTDPEKGTLSVTIKNLPSLLEAVFVDAGDAINTLWQRLISAITGNGGKKPLPDEIKALLKDSEVSSQLAAGIRQAYDPKEYDYGNSSQKSKWQLFAEELGSTIIEVFEKLPEWILNGINAAITKINEAFSVITETMMGALADENPVDAVTEALDPESANNKNDSGLSKSLKKIGTNLVTLISTTLPSFITTGFELIKLKASEWTSSLSGIFDEINNNDILKQSVIDIGTNIETWIKGIPTTIRSAIEDAKLAIQKFFGINQDALIVGNDPRFVGKNQKENLDKSGEEIEKETNNSTLWDTIKSVAAKIGDAFKNAFDELWPQASEWFAGLPTHFTNGLNTVMEMLNSGIEWVGNWFSEHSQDTIEKQTEDFSKDAADAVSENAEKGASEGENGFKKAIGNLWLTFEKLIIETLPKAISNGFEYIKTHWKEWIAGIYNIFSDVDIKPEDISVTNILSGIRTAFEQLPQKISELFKKPVIDETSMADPVGEVFDDAGKKVEESAETSSFWNTLIDLGKNIGEQIAAGIEWAINNLGDIVVNGWNNALTTAGNLMGTLSDWFAGGANEEDGSLGDAVDKNFKGVKPELQTALTNIGLTIKKLFVHTIPRFIGDAIGTVIRELPNMWNELWSGISETANKSAKENTENNKEISGAEDAVKETGNIIENLLSNMNTQIITGTLTTGGAIVVGLLALMEIFKMIKEVINTFNITGNWAERVEARNSIEAVFKRMLTALIAAMALVVYVSQLDDTKFERVKIILTQLISALEVIAGLYSATTLISGGMDIYKLKKGEAVDKETVKALTRKEKTLNSITDLYGGITSSAKVLVGGAAVGGAANMIGSSVSDIISQLIGNFAQMGESIKIFTERIGTTFDDVGSLLDKIANAGTVIDATLDLLKKIREVGDYSDAVASANGIFGQLTGPLGLFAKQFEGDLHPKEVVDAITALMSMTSQMTTFANFTTEHADVFNQFKYAIGSIGSALSFYSNANGITDENVTTTGISNAVKVLQAIVGNDELMGIADIFADNTLGENAKDFYSGAEQMALFAGALSQLGSAITGLSTENVEAFSKFYNDIVSKISIDDVRGDTEGSTTFAQKMHVLGSGLQSFAQAINGIKQEDVTVAGYALDMLASIAERAKHFENGALVGWITGSGDLAQFAVNIGLVGTQLQSFLSAVSIDPNGEAYEINFDAIKTAMFALQQLATAASRINQKDVNALKDLLQDGGALGNSIAFFMSGLFYYRDDENIAQNIDPETFNFEYVKTILTAFGEFGHFVETLSSSNQTTKQILEHLVDQNHGIISLASKIVEVFKTFSAVANDNDIDINVVRDVTNIVNSIFDSIAAMNVFDPINGYKVFSGADSMQVAIDALSVLNQDLSILTRFLDNMQTLTGKYNVGEIYQIIDIIRNLGEALNMYATNGISNVAYATDGLLNLQTLSPTYLTSALSNIFSALNTFVTDQNNAEMVKASGTSMAMLLFEGIDEAFKNQNLHLQPEITPVLNDGELRSQMAALFGIENPQDFNFGKAFSDSVNNSFATLQAQQPYTPVLNDISSKLDKLGYLDRFDMNLSNVASALSSAKVVVDREQMAYAIGPYMDRYLARVGYISMNHATT